MTPPTPLVNGYIRFVAFDEEDDSEIGEITDATDKSVLVELDGPGGLEFTLNRISDQRQDCRPGRFIRVYLTDTIDETITSDPIAGYIVSESDNALVQEQEYGAEDYRRSAEGFITVLSDAIAWHESVTSTDAAAPTTEDDAWHWTAAMGAYMPGIVVRMLEEAQERGCFPFVTWDFTRTADSDGTPWSSDVAITDYKLNIGTDLLSLLGDAQGLGLVFQMSPDWVLSCRERANFGSDLSGSVSFERGDNLSAGAVQKQIAAPARSSVLVKGTRGDNGETTWVEADSAAGLDEVKRRKEGFLDAGSTTGFTTLTNLGLESIYQKLRLRLGPSALPVLDSTLRPFTDYQQGDTVTVDVPGAWNSEARQITGVQLTDRETGDYDVLLVFDAGPSYQSKGSTVVPVGITECCPPDGPFVPEEVGTETCTDPTADGTYGPNLSATSAGTGNVFYIKPGVIEPGLVPNPGYVGAWSFAVYNSGGVDYAGDCTGSTARCLVIGNGVAVIHTATYSGSARTVTATLRHWVAGTPTTDSFASATTGTDIVVPVSTHGGDHCTHTIDVVDAGPTCGGKWGFAGFDWVQSPPTEIVNAPTYGQSVHESNTGDGSTTTWNTNYPYLPGSLQVHVNGLLVGVTETDPTTGEFDFDTAPATGSVIVIIYQAASPTGTGAGNDATPDPYTPTIITGDFVTTSDGGGEVINTVASSGSTETLDLADGNVHDVTLTANCTFTFAAVDATRARSFTLLLRQDGTGGRDVTWPGSVVWAGGSAPTLDTTASTTAVLTFFTLDGGTSWYGFAAGGSGIASLDDIPDVNAPSPSDGDVLTWDSTPGEWVAATPTAVGDLDDLSDVTITSPVAGARLRYDGTGWVDSTLIWRPVMTYDGTNWLVAVDGSGNAIMTEA